MLYVKATGHKTWVLRYQMGGKRRDLGLGRYPTVGLAEARLRTEAARKLIAAGQDPLAQVKDDKRLTFEEAANALIANKRAGWKSEMQEALWVGTFERYVYPSIGRRDVSTIETGDVLSILEPIWPTKPETASRVRQRVEAVLDYAKVAGARSGDNCARWKGHLDHILPKPTKVKPVEHHAALSWQEAPAFWAELAGKDTVAARALRFTILTAARSGEVRRMTWSELDIEAAVWIVPADRMKQAKEHRVPLCKAALELLGDPGKPDALVFPSDFRPGKPLTDVGVTRVIRTMGNEKTTVHGWRATFRTWAGESTNFPREVVEGALAHQIKDKAERAYVRDDLFTKKRKLMEAWAGYLQGGRGANVDSFRGLR